MIDDNIRIVESVPSPASPAEPASRIPVLKVILGGDANVGKTSLIQRHCTGVFRPTRSMTIGIDFHVYQVKIENAPVRLIVWDLGGQERFSPARRAFYRGTRAVGLVFDASNRHSFYNLMKWWREVRTHLNDVPVMLLANKADLPRQVSPEETSAIAKAWGIPLFESSCATGNGVTEFFDALARTAWEHSRKTSPPHPIEFRERVSKKGEDK